jgi:hypothetical protein
MIVQLDQLKTFHREEVHKFILLTLDFVRNELAEYASLDDDKTVRKKVVSIIYLSQEAKIKSELNVQRLVFFQYCYGFKIPLEEPLRKRLFKPGLHEDDRVADFYDYLLKHSENQEIN